MTLQAYLGVIILDTPPKINYILLLYNYYITTLINHLMKIQWIKKL